MSEEYYKGELLSLVDSWTTEQLDRYIQGLEDRIMDTRGQITALKALKRRKSRNKNLKDNGPRGNL